MFSRCAQEILQSHLTAQRVLRHVKFSGSSSREPRTEGERRLAQQEKTSNYTSFRLGSRAL